MAKKYWEVEIKVGNRWYVRRTEAEAKLVNICGSILRDLGDIEKKLDNTHKLIRGWT